MIKLAAAVVGDVNAVDPVIECNLCIFCGADALDDQRQLEVVFIMFNLVPIEARLMRDYHFGTPRQIAGFVFKIVSPPLAVFTQSFDLQFDALGIDDGKHAVLVDYLPALGLIDHMPRLIGVQSDGSRYLVDAFENDEDVLTKPPAPADTVADSISAALPRDRM